MQSTCQLSVLLGTSLFGIISVLTVYYIIVPNLQGFLPQIAFEVEIGTRIAKINDDNDNLFIILCHISCITAVQNIIKAGSLTDWVDHWLLKFKVLLLQQDIWSFSNLPIFETLNAPFKVWILADSIFRVE